MSLKKAVFFSSILSVIIIAIYMLKNYHPEESALFPRCPSKYITGFDCPGCGLQRAIHSLLNGNLSNAFNYNQLFFILIPYGIAVGIFEWIPVLKNHPYRRVLINKVLVLTILCVIVIFTIYRNL